MISNTTTWMGGRCNIARVSAETCGVVEAETWLKPKDQAFLRARDPSQDDGLLELCTLNSMVSFVFQNMDRVGQCKGPLEFAFRENATDAYFQLDGEMYKAVKPLKAYMRLTDKLENGKLKILVNNEFIQPDNTILFS